MDALRVAVPLRVPFAVYREENMTLDIVYAAQRQVFVKDVQTVVDGRWKQGGFGDEVYRQLSWQSCAGQLLEETAIVVLQENHGDRAFSFSGREVPLSAAVRALALVHMPATKRTFRSVPESPECTADAFMISSTATMFCYQILGGIEWSSSLRGVLQNTCAIPGPMCVLDRQMHWRELGAAIHQMKWAVRSGIRANVVVFVSNGVSYKYMTDKLFEL